RITRIRVGAEGSEPVAQTQSTPGETVVSRKGGNTPALWSSSQETPATRPQGFSGGRLHSGIYTLMRTGL
ncbi:MAG: hypothetical protein KGI54_17005, partial [Pseudomonadota bacterium]|nr:hypothetical protein [Pseudomonadota bacterium]